MQSFRRFGNCNNQLSETWLSWRSAASSSGRVSPAWHWPNWSNQVVDECIHSGRHWRFTYYSEVFVELVFLDRIEFFQMLWWNEKCCTTNWLNIWHAISCWTRQNWLYSPRRFQLRRPWYNIFIFQILILCFLLFSLKLKLKFFRRSLNDLAHEWWNDWGWWTRSYWQRKHYIEEAKEHGSEC